MDDRTGQGIHESSPVTRPVGDTGLSAVPQLISRPFWAILRRPMRKLLALASALTSSLVLGCSTPCEDLAERICNCQLPGGSARDACISGAGSQIDSATQRPSDADQNHCTELLKTCHAGSYDVAAGRSCSFLQTVEGQVACGIADPQVE